MKHKGISRTVSTLALARTDAGQFHTVSKLSRLSSAFEPLESRMMMSAAPVHPVYPQLQSKTPPAVKAATSLVVPTSVAISALSPTSVKVTWADADANATGYYVFRATDGAFTKVATITSRTTLNCTDTTAAENTSYSYKVQAYNSTLTSAYSATVAVRTPLIAPSGLTANAASGTTVVLNWTDNDTNATGYVVYRATGATPLALIANVSGGTLHTYTDNSALSGHAYSYDVVATAGSQHNSGMSNLGNVCTPLSAPSGLTANATSGTTVVLNWTNHDSSATGFNILRSTDGTHFTSIAKPTGATLSSYTDATTLSDHSYYYQVQALTSAASSPAVTSAAVTTLLNAPTGVAAATVGSSVVVTWANKDSGATGYTIFRSTNGTSFNTLGQLTSGTATSYLDSTATSGQKYYYQVQATGSTVNSAKSATASVTLSTPTTTNTVSITTRNSDELVIAATGKDDTVSVSESGSTLNIVADGQTTSQSVPAGGLFIYTHGGADGINIDQTVSTRTTVETIDGSLDDITSAGSNVYVWDDSSDIFTGTGTVRSVTTFAGSVAKTAGVSLADPKDAGKTMKVTGSLFGTGPVAGDVNQGAVGDCYFDSSLAAFATQNPALLEGSAVDMGDGTYTVQFVTNSGAPEFVRVSSDISTNGNGSFVYDRPGTSGNLWAVIMEKAYAYFRTGANTIASLNSGWMGSVYAALGVNSSFFYLSSMTADTLASSMTAAMSSGKEVTFGTPQSPPDLVGGHAYTLISCSTDSNGNTTYLVRNPWGVQGRPIENGQGYATLTFAQMQSNFIDCCVSV